MAWQALSKLSAAEDIRFTSVCSGFTSFNWLQNQPDLLALILIKPYKFRLVRQLLPALQAGVHLLEVSRCRFSQVQAAHRQVRESFSILGVLNSFSSFV